MVHPQKSPLHSTLSKGLKLLLLIAIIVGIFFRFWQIDRKVYWIDEVHTSLRSVGYSRSEFVEQVPRDRPLSIDEFHQFQRLSPSRGWDDSLNALAQNAEHTPLYYLCVRLAMTVLGSSVTVTRAVAAFFSLLCLPAIYALCHQLWAYSNLSQGTANNLSEADLPSPSNGTVHIPIKARVIGSLAVILLAVSPLQILYAQEARQYSLYGLMTLASSAALLRSLQRHKTEPKSPFAIWWPYAVSASLLLYSHLIGALVLFTQGIYTLVTQRRAWRRQALSVGAALVSLLPWVALYFANASHIGAWTGRDIGVGTLAQRWLLNLSSLWFDFQARFPEMQLFDVERGQDFAVLGQPIVWLSFGFLGLAIASLYLCCRNLPRSASSFLLLLVVLPSGLLLIPDLLSGGQRTGIARYLLPSYLSITIAVAYGLSWLLSQRQKWLGIGLNNWGRSLLALLLVLSIFSNSVSAQSATWWNKYSCFYDAAVAEQINGVEDAIVISSPRRASRLLALSYQLDPETPLWFVGETGLEPENSQLKLPEQFQTLFLFRPSNALVGALTGNSAYEIEPVFEEGHLWRINVVEPIAALSDSDNPMRRCIELLG